MKNTFLKFWKNPCQLIYMVMVLLLFIGGTNVFSASFVTARDMTGSGVYFLKRYFIFALVGFGAMAVVRAVGYKAWLNRKPLWAFFAVVLVMLVYVDAVGIATKGASRWIYLGPISLQPSEFAQLSVIMLAAKYLGGMLRRGETVSFFASGDHRYVQLATFIYGVLVYKQPDLGTAAIIVALVLGMYIIAGLPKGQLVAILSIGLLVAVGATLSSSYRLERVQVWFDPWLG